MKGGVGCLLSAALKECQSQFKCMLTDIPCVQRAAPVYSLHSSLYSRTCASVVCPVKYSSLMFVRVFIISVLAVARACPPCDLNSCPEEPERSCSLGAVPDPCQCCPLGRCGLGEGQLCYNATVFEKHPDKRRLGACATNMVCMPRNDLGPTDGLETMCVCADQRIACGSDNRTYESSCKMYRAEFNKRVTLQHWGPCHQAPQVTSGPEAVKTVTGHAVQLACEAKGFPVPAISWQFQKNDGSIVVLPGDDTSVSVQVRGGPEKLMVSSWVQLTQSRLIDSGEYSCVADNQLGSARASAHVSIQTNH